MSKVSKNIKPAAKPQNAARREDDTNGVIMARLVGVFALLCIICTVVFDKSREMGGAVFPVMSLLALAVFAGLMFYENKLNAKTAVYIIIAAGFILRLNYVIYTPLSETVRVRQHDVFSFGSEKGHSGYIEHFYNNGFTLPDFNPTTKAQFYHPPLNHIIAATWMRLLTTFGMGYTRAIGSLMFLPLFYSSCLMIVCERIFTQLRMSSFSKIIAMSVIACHPTLIMLSGSINNDMPALLFTMLAVYTTLRWHREPTTKNILYIALSIGLGMSTKISVGLVSIPIAAVFLIKLVKEKKKVFENIVMYVKFGLVCLPLGLWYPVRNAIKFKVPMTYVQKLGDDADQYLGNRTVFERLLDYSEHPFENVFLNKETNGAPYFEYNPFVSIIKTSLSGEYTFTDTNENILPFCRILLILNVIMIALSIAAMIVFIIKKNRYIDFTEKLLIVSYQVLMFVYFIKFSFDFPHMCSMDFRYIVPTMIQGMMFIGCARDVIAEDTKNEGAVKAVNITAVSATSLFCLFAAVVFIMLGVSTE